MTYADAMAYLREAEVLGSSMGLDTIRALLQRMGNPEKNLPVIHVAGTNGKGSVVAYLTSVLAAAGYRVGRFTSPDLYSFTERISINGKAISEADVARLTEVIARHAAAMEYAWEGAPTVFEISTAMAFQYFREQHCDLAVLEVGLGGRLDATNVVSHPLVSVITSIGMDHTELLGDTLSKIAWEKAGIIKERCPVVTAPQAPEAMEAIEKACLERGSECFPVRRALLRTTAWDGREQRFDYGRFQNLSISLLGEHQLVNAATALTALQVLQPSYPVSQEALRAGLSATRWPCRLEVLREKPLALVDGAHNPQGVGSLAAGLIRHFPGKKFSFLVGVLADKDYRAMFDPVIPLAERFITITPNSHRALPAQQLADFLKQRYPVPVETAPTVSAALESVIPQLGDKESFCAFGSLYYVGEVRKWFDTHAKREK